MRRLVVLAVAAAACGGSNSSPGATGAQVQQVDTLAQNMAAAVGSYRASTGNMSTTPACQTAESSYRAQMGSMLDQMKQMSGPMDDAMKRTGHSEDADVMCGSNAMQAEFARHDAVPCAAADMTTNRAEATNHADAMMGLIDHQRARAAQVGSTMGMTGMMDAGSMVGTDGGWTAPDGGMMGACHVGSDGGYMMDGGM